MSEKQPGQINYFQDLFNRKNRKNVNLDLSGNKPTEPSMVDYLTSFIQNHPDIILILSLEGDIISRNKNTIYNHLGYPEGQYLSIEELLSKEVYSQLVSTLQKSTSGSSERLEFSVLNKNSEQIFILLTFIPITSPDGVIEAILATLQDITIQKELEQTNILKTSHLEQAQDIAKVGSWQFIIATNEVTSSKSSYDIFGYTDSETFSMDGAQSVIHPDDQAQSNEIMGRAIQTGESQTGEFRIYHAVTGELRYIKTKIEVVIENDVPIKLIGVVQDITEQKELTIQLTETNQMFQNIFDHLQAGIWMSESSTGNITFASQGLLDIMQIPAANIYEKPNYWLDMIHPRYHKTLFEQYDLLNMGNNVEFHYEIIDGNGEAKWIFEQTIPKINEHGEVTQVFGMIRDVTSETKMQERLTYLAQYDALTGLPNINSLHEKMYTLLNEKNNKPFALFYIDLNDFGSIIDYLGHEAGNAVFQKIANRLILTLSDRKFLSRVDSKSFILVVTDFSSKEEVFQIAEDIIKKIGGEVLYKDYQFYVTASLGISFYPDNGDNELMLIENAHTALYHARRLGQNNYQIYSFDRDISSHKKYMLEIDLRTAINNENFELYYQPQVDPNNGRIISAEALIRWNHEDWGIVSPNEFIPLAEEKHLFHHIENWVIKTVCKQIDTWKKQGFNVCPVAINITPMHFFMPGLVDTLQIQLDKYDISPSLIKIEVTESSLLQNNDMVAKKLHAFEKLGVKVELDDFGTGYSSFEYLQNFNLDTLKIDKMFIQNIGDRNKKDEAIISAFLHLAKGLDMKVIAEGVETFEQLEFLRNKECDMIQGYLYSKPVPTKDFEQLMKKVYIEPQKQISKITPEIERRKSIRFIFPQCVIAKMNIIEANKKKVNIGSATILIENISLGGIRFISTLKLPIMRNYKLNFKMKILNELFDLNGTLVYVNEDKMDTLVYGVNFSLTEREKEKLTRVINKISKLNEENDEIPDTDFITEDPYLFLNKRTF